MAQAFTGFNRRNEKVVTVRFSHPQFAGNPRKLLPKASSISMSVASLATLFALKTVGSALIVILTDLRPKRMSGNVEIPRGPDGAAKPYKQYV